MTVSKGLNMRMNKMVIASAVSVALLLSACASSPPGGSASSDAPTSNRYAKALAYPDRLQPVGSDGAMRWMDPTVDFRKYDRILIERIRVDLDSESSSVDPDQLKALVDYFRQAVVKAIDPPYRIVDKAGRGVLRVRATLVDLVATKPDMSVVVLLTPYATIPDLISGAAGGGPAGSAPYLGRSAIAVEFIDGETNAVVAEYAELRFGRKYVLNTSQGTTQAVTGAATNYLDAYSTWAYAKQAFDQWAAQFRSRLDQINGR
jgi:Protein of unknown function (DUF3313)